LQVNMFFAKLGIHIQLDGELDTEARNLRFYKSAVELNNWIVVCWSSDSATAP
jgi:hypothetical protein